jgi:hypothetical protein
VPSIPDDYYAGIIVFYHGEQIVKDSLPSFLKKAQQNNAKLLLITSRTYAESPFLKQALKTYEEAHLLLYGDIFGVSAHEISVLTHMVHEAARTGKVSVHGSGLSETYPVYYADVLQGILHILLSHGGPKVGLLYPRTPVPQIHLARLITKLFPHATIMFIGQEERARQELPQPEGETLVADPYPLSEKLHHVAAFTKVPGVRLPKPRKRRFGSSSRRFLPFGIILAGFAVLLPFITLMFFLFGLLSLKVALTAAKRGELPLAHARAETAHSFLSLAQASASLPVALSRPVGVADMADDYLKRVQAADTAAGVVAALAAAGEAGQHLRASAAREEDLLALTYQLKQAIFGLGELRADQALPAAYQAELATYQPAITRASGLIESLPVLAGLGQERTYLVLFQNNMELRPGGGFIGSYGLLTVKNGGVSRFTVHTVDDADGQLTGAITPPFALERYLGASHLFLRDTNFGVEFGRNAAAAAELLRLSTDTRVDGVIAMDVSFLRSLLRVTGPVYLPAYNENVNAETFYLTAQKHAEANFFPGSSQKQDFLQYVGQAMLRTLTERPDLPATALLTTMEQAVSEKHLMIALAEPGLMRVMTENGLAPSVQPSGEERRADIADVIGVFDANLGTNKVNYYLKRSFSQHVSVQADASREGTMTVLYTNTSAVNSPFGGDYQNYVQVLLPETAEVTGISLNGVEQTLVPAVTSSRVFRAERFVPPAGLEVERTTTDGRSLTGFFLTVPAGTRKSVAISYRLPALHPLPSHFSSVLRVIKQPGTDFDPYGLVLDYDPSFTLVQAPVFASRTENTLRVTQELASDMILPLTFSKE